MAEKKSLSWTRLESPIKASKLKKLADSDGIFHVEFLLDFDGISNHARHNGYSEDFADILVEDKIVSDMCHIENFDYYPYKVEGNSVVIRATGEVVSHEFFDVEVTYTSTVMEVLEVEAKSETEALELAKEKICKQRNINESIEILKAEILDRGE